MKPMCDSLDILQADKHVGMGYLLPTLTVLRKKLMSFTDDTSITLCQALVNSLLDAIHFRFDKMFTDNELRLATITNPMFKLSWLEKDEDIERAKSLLTCEYNRLKGIVQEASSSDESSDCSSSSLSGPSPIKQRKKNFFASITKKRRNKRCDDEVDNYLNLCDSLDKLCDYPIIQQIYKRYNVTLPSSASVERLFSQGGLIYSARRMKMTDIHFEMLLFLKVNNKTFKDW
ncbi:uncharacterized protein LOC116927472 [Daphnia magna]|uniref:uncharacterized protein LOC116927472 n=1 Tax=Daphnia magna TaxID=35525 RepID=UPI001E1BBEB1|nr:uncharacterized protein LOC116927472 [Daphnia magna]